MKFSVIRSVASLIFLRYISSKRSVFLWVEKFITLQRKRLSKEQILMLHSQLMEQTGGTLGVRDFNLLESAIETPFQSFAGEELYPTIQAKGICLGYGLIKNHCMLDGNKRIGTHMMLVFLFEGETVDEKVCKNEPFPNDYRSNIYYIVFYCSKRVFYIHKFLFLSNISNILLV